MDKIYVFSVIYLKWIFAAICLAVLVEGISLSFFPDKITRWLEKMPHAHLRLIGIGEIIFSLIVIFFILYR